ncbi:MAG: NAD(P)/FAD-dependent oxidoreductase [Polyangiaceae bacterium]
MRRVVVVGAGLAGLAVSALLSRAGFSIVVVESRRQAPQQEDSSRSINLALSARGIRTLDELGITREAMQSAVPMYGRRLHLPDGTEEFESYDLVGNNAIYSIRRSRLWKLLSDAAQASGVVIRYDASCVDVDAESRTVTLSDYDGRRSDLAFDALLGCDGAHSAVRRALGRSGAVATEMQHIRHGYMELSFPRSKAQKLEPDGLHIWARKDHMLVALPNADGSFAGTVFVPLEHEGSNRFQSKREQLLAVLEQHFADATELVADLSGAVSKNPLCRLFATRCDAWSHAGSVLLMGDAVHSMAPFYGQGMNCALEDCHVFMRCMERGRGDWPTVFADFERSRRPDTDAITNLSQANYREMSHHGLPNNHKLRREIERALQARFPEACVPLYALVSFQPSDPSAGIDEFAY